MFSELRNLLRYWKLLTFRKLLFFFHILSRREKRALLFFLAVALGSGGVFGARVYMRVTEPVPGVGGSYREGARGEPRVINPLFAISDADRDITRLVFSGLLKFDGEGALKEDLAERYEISDDGNVYTIIIRKGILWHDGEALTADDVLFTVAVLKNQKFKSPLRANWQGVETEALDSLTVRFTLKAPYAPFVENLTVGILPKHLWERVGPEQIYLHELNLKPVGTGPYQFDTFVKEKDGSLVSYQLKRNKKFYGGGPYLEKIKFLFFQNEDDLRTSWRRGDIDGYGPVSHKETFAENERARVAEIRMPRIFGLFFNQKKAPLLEDKVIREAIARALARKEIAQFAASDGAIPYGYPLPPLTANTTNSSVPYEFDLDYARAILAKNYWTDENKDGIREKRIRKNKKEKAVETPLAFVLTTSDWPDFIRAAERIKSALQEIGIDIQINAIPYSLLEDRVIKPRDFEILLFGHVYGYQLDPFPFWHSSQIKDPGLNITLFTNKKVDSLLESARRTNDPALRDRNYLEFQKIVLEEIPAVFLYSQLYLYLLPNDLKGTSVSKISLPSDRFNTVNEWYKETKRVWRSKKNSE